MDTLDTSSLSDDNSCEVLTPFELRCLQMRENLKKLEQVKNVERARNDLIHVSNQLRSVGDKLSDTVRSYLILRVLLNQDNEPEGNAVDASSVAIVQSLLAEFRVTYRELHAGVRQSPALPDLIDKSKALYQEIAKTNATGWHMYVQQLQNQWHVNTDLFDRQSHIPSCKVVFDKYIDAKKDFTALVRKPPTSRDSLDKVLTLNASLCELRNQMNLDIPKEVDLFLKNSARPQGAALEDLTPEVLKWLKQHDEPTRYYIKRK